MNWSVRKQSADLMCPSKHLIRTCYAHSLALLDLQGAPFNIKDFKVLLDKQVYEGLEGRWVDLFNRMKWDIIKSVLKSVAGLQGRKFKVSACAVCTV